MRKMLRVIFVLATVAALLFIVVLFAFYLALRHEPQWYARATTATDQQAEEKASDEMLQNAADLTSALETSGDWVIVFTADQINGWLAVDMPKNHPELLPSVLSNPRVAITPDGITLAARYTGSGISTVVSLTFTVYMAEENVIAARVCKARAGRIPWSITKIVDTITSAAARSDLRLSWRQIKGDPLALITIPDTRDSGRRRVRINSLLVDDGKIIVGGTTGGEARQIGDNPPSQ